MPKGAPKVKFNALTLLAEHTPRGELAVSTTTGSGRLLKGKSLSAGFSLVEILVSAAVVVILAAILFAVIRSARESSARAGCTSNLRQIGSALFLYAADHGGELPYREEGPDDNRRPTPYWNAPLTLANALVGDRGSEGYLEYQPTPQRRSNQRSTWSDSMQCPSDPNEALWGELYGYSRSYIYRQSDNASKSSGRPIRLGMPRSDQEIRPRWLVACRWATVPSQAETPYPGGERNVAQGRHPSGVIDGSSVSSYWHQGGTFALYEDGSVMWRSYPNESLGQW